MPPNSSSTANIRLERIQQARQLALTEQRQPGPSLIEPWITRSWQRCLNSGMHPSQRVAFEAVSNLSMRRAEEANRSLVAAARPVLHGLSRAMQDTHYFAILTNRAGVVVDTHGPIDRSDRRVDLITRVGVDLSEQAVGTTAIGAALTELSPVWLHRGEHFFDDTSVYSCAGAPLFGPDGECVGMLDLTGVQAVERPELRHLVVQAAHNIENALALAQPHALLLRLNWPEQHLGGHADGLVGVDADGYITATNSVARQLLPQLAQGGDPRWHCGDIFAMAFELLFDAARHGSAALEAPLWSGLRLLVLPSLAQADSPAPRPYPAGTGLANSARRPLKDLQTALIRKAVQDAKGNVAQAAQNLGISRATVYRKLHSGLN